MQVEAEAEGKMENPPVISEEARSGQRPFNGRSVTERPTMRSQKRVVTQAERDEVAELLQPPEPGNSLAVKRSDVISGVNQ